MTRYFVDHGNGSGLSALLKMENLLYHFARERWDQCVLSDAACKRAVEEIKAEQERIRKENPRLRTVEISYEPADMRHSWACGRIRIGQASLILRFINEWFDE